MARTRDALERTKAERARTADGPAAEGLSARATALADLNARLRTLYEVLQEADAAPTPAAVDTADTLRAQVVKVLGP
jgi:hypothetical protein